MKEPKDFTIDKVAWHTSVSENPETPEDVRRRFRVLVNFLQDNALACRKLLRVGEDVEEEFVLRKSDLTEEGYAVIKLAYDKWLKTVVNKRRDVDDLSLFHKALAKVRAAK